MITVQDVELRAGARLLLQDVTFRVQPGDRIALMLPNCPQYVIAYYGTLLAGAIVVQINPLYTPRELEHLLNNAGNRTFCLCLGWLLGSHITDTLCGTKAMRRSNWMKIRAARHLFGGHDPWGDFDLLLGAGYSGLRIVDVPIVYGARVAGESKMRPFAHGLDLAKTCFAGLKVLKLDRPTRPLHE